MPVAGAPHPLAQAPLAGQTMIIAHRGYRACYPENTLCAFNASLGRCAMIELDVQLSRDGIPVVFHDYTLERTSNATSIGPSSRPPSLALGGWALAELLQLDIGSWFLRDDPFGTIRSQLISKTALQPLMPQRIMTLEQTLYWASVQQMPLNVELKAANEEAAALVGATIRLIRQTKTTSLILVSSFHHDCLRLCRQLAPEIATAALQEKSHPQDVSGYLKALGVSAYHPADAITDRPLINTIRAAGMAINVFTVNGQARQTQLANWGATGLFTDYPQQPFLVSQTIDY